MREAEKRLERFQEELWGAVLLFISIFLFLILFSYRVEDQSFFSQGTEQVKNLGGVVGSYLSALFFQSFGISSFLIFILLFFASGYKLFRKKPLIKGKAKTWIALRAIGIFLLLIFFSTFLSLIKSELSWRGEEIKTAGWIGYLLANACEALFGRVGALAMVSFGILISLVLGFHLSITRMAKVVVELIQLGFDWLGEMVQRFREKRRRKTQVEEQKKILESHKTQPEPKIVETPILDPGMAKEPTLTPAPQQGKLHFFGSEYRLPSLKLLDAIPANKKSLDRDSLLLRARLLEKKLLDFGVSGEVMEVSPGPVVTMYEYKPASGIKIHQISNLADDLACALSALSVRIIAPLPGKGVIGIEIPNQERETVYLKELIASSVYHNSRSLLTMALGKNIVGEPFVIDLRKAPHLLVAGATGSGKSVSLNAMIMSVLFRVTPDQVRMLLIDPKRLELSTYEGIPHLLHSVISEPKEAALSLKWAVVEMERRYSLLAEYGVRNIDAYNRMVDEGKKNKKKKPRTKEEGSTLVLERTPEKYPTQYMPLLLVVIDELADLMMIASRDCEASITRLAQMARAAGIHLIVATQRPSVDVITGLIKANFSARISFQVSSKIDSRTILDQNGAEKLLGLGDMLFMAPGSTQLVRVHGAYVSETEVKRVVSFWKKQGSPEYNESVIKPSLEAMAEGEGEKDELYEQAVELVVRTRQASVSMLQRKLRVGYNRSARMIEQMEKEGIVGPADGVKPREVLVDPIQLENIFKKKLKGAI